MMPFRRIIQQLLDDQAGNIGISAVILAPVLLVSAGMGIDYGLLTLQKRELQTTADLAAIAAASNPANAARIVASQFAANGLNILTETKAGFLAPDGTFLDAPASDDVSIARIEIGSYSADPLKNVAERFVPNAQPGDAARVTIEQAGQIYFLSAMTKAPKLEASGIAHSQRTASFSIGSRLLRVDGGLLNSMLSAMIGTSISLDLMDYQALLDADVDLLSLIEQIGIDMHLTAATYDDVLKLDLTYSQFLSSLSKTGIVSPKAASIVTRLIRQVPSKSLKLQLASLIKLDVLGPSRLGTRSGAAANTNLLSVINAGAAIASGKEQIGLNLASSIPGLVSSHITLSVGSPTVDMPPNRIGGPGSQVRTAQTRIAFNSQLSGILALAGTQLELPIYAEIAHAEAQLVDITCSRGKPVAVVIDVVPGPFELSVGQVDPRALAYFASKPRVEQAALVSSPLLEIFAKAYLNASNITHKRLTFSAADIASGKSQTVSTKDAITSATQSLLSKLSIDVKLLFVSLGTPQAILYAVGQTLGNVTKPLDDVLYNTLQTLGIGLGQADIRVTSAQCSSPVLVQ